MCVHLCRWDYAIEERDAEITELKRRLVEAEHKAREAASKAAEELRVMGAELQVSLQARCSLFRVTFMQQLLGPYHTLACLLGLQGSFARQLVCKHLC